MIKEPKRLIEVDSGPLAESLAASRLRVPSDARMAAMASRLSGAGVVWGEPTQPQAGPELSLARRPRSGKSLELSLKALLAALALGGVAVVGALLWRSGATHAPENASTALPTSAPPSAPAARPPAAELARAQTAAIAERARNGSAAPGRLSAQASDVRAGTEATPTSGADAAPLDATAALAPPARAAAPANAPAAENAPASVTASPRARSAEPEAKRAVSSSPAARTESAESNGERLPLPASTVVDSEVEMLKKARNALGSDPVQAYALTERCRAQYPSGAFAQERDFIAISSLVRMGRQDEARGRASLFRTRYRHSAYLPQLTRMLGEE